MKFVRLPSFLIAAALLAPMDAVATTIDFSTLGAGPLGGAEPGSTSYIDPGTGLVVDGLWLNDATWEAAPLYVRNEENDHGFGICSPADDPPCPGPEGGGDFNELDNADAPEVIRLTLPFGYEWVSVQLSSLDSNSSTNPALLERGQLWTGDAPIPSFLGDSFLDFAGGGEIEPSFLIDGSAAGSPFLFFRPYDFSPGGTNVNNDFLVYGVTIRQTRVPEPVTLGLIGIGLLALGVRRRRR